MASALSEDAIVEVKDGKITAAITFQPTSIMGLPVSGADISEVFPEPTQENTPVLGEGIKGDLNEEAKTNKFTFELSTLDYPKLSMTVASMGNAIMTIRLKFDMDSLSEIVDKTALGEKISEAEEISAEGYTEDSYNALLTAIDNAKAVMDNENAKQSEVNAQISALENAISALTEEVNNRPEIKDGTYSAKASLVKLNKTDNSMASGAIDSEIKIVAKDGVLTAYIKFKGLNVGTMEGYLGELYYYGEDYSYDAQANKFVGTANKAEVISVYKDADGNVFTDKYNDADSPYPSEVAFPIVVDGDFIPLKVVVPVMESFGAGLGTHDVYLNID